MSGKTKHPGKLYLSDRGFILRRSLKLYFIAFMFSMIFWQSAFAAETKPSVAVLDFESIGSEAFLGKAVAEIMRTEFVGTQGFRVVERSQIEKALEEQKLHMSGIINDSSAVELGKLVGADFIVVGSVVKIGNAYTINSRMIEVKTGEARLGRNVTGNDVDLLTSMSRELVAGLLGKEPKKTSALDPQPSPKAEAKTTGHPYPPVKARSADESGITWDFETKNLKGWNLEGNAFHTQPTFGDNPTARHRGQASGHQGDYWIGGFENRPKPYDPPGRIQGDGPQGTLESDPFTIDCSRISFMISGGCDISVVRVELVIDGKVVKKATGQCHETLVRYYWDVSPYKGKKARVRLVDHSSSGWGHINFDDLRFE